LKVAHTTVLARIFIPSKNRFLVKLLCPDVFFACVKTYFVLLQSFFARKMSSKIGRR
jgi:hypothetical protein